jgi:hypothetical protein
MKRKQFGIPENSCKIKMPKVKSPKSELNAEDLKCCGNCYHSCYNYTDNLICLINHNCFSHFKCKKWKFDCLLKDDRNNL